MNQPRNDYPGNRSVAHSTGRSNYGGSRRGAGKKETGPIGKWIQSRRQRRRNMRRGEGPVAVGTEANAIQNMARNAKHFAYPPEGFITPVEHSLLYSMIEFPERYPEDVVKGEIDDEDFTAYLYVKIGSGRPAASGQDGAADREGDDHAQSQPEDERVAYGQLSALAALSAAKNPSTAAADQTNTSASAGSSNPSSARGTKSACNSRSSNPQQPTDGPPAAADQTPTYSIGQALVRKLIKTVTRYSDAHGLDREHEIREFLSPIETRCQLRNEQAALKQLLPAYAGYTLSLVTGNPLPLLIGAVALAQRDPMQDENSNVSGFRTAGGRAGDLETAGLLDECESE